MTSAANPTLPQADVATVPPVDDRVLKRRSFLARLAMDVIGRWGARIGAAWIGLLVLLAVSAPLIASSHPLLWKHGGSVESPWLDHLTPTDAALFIAFLAAAVLCCFRSVPVGRRVAAWVWLVALAAPLTGWAEAWRWLEAAEGGQAMVRWAIALAGALPLVAILVLVPVLMRDALRLKLAVGAAGAVLAAVLVVFPVTVPDAVVLSKYREAHAAGQVDWAVYAPIPYSPTDRQRDVLSRTGVDPRLLPPGEGGHLMGTTDNGADLASRMIHASRIALAIGLIATGIAVTIGIVIGGLMGYFAGWIDLIGMRLVEIFSAIPVIFLLIMIVAFYGRSLYLMMVIIGLTGWVGYALYVRAEFLKLRHADYVQAARALGVPLWSILFRHMLPNGLTPVLVLASFGIASAILTESTLSFLGLGLVEEPSWGQMLNQARTAGGQWGLVLFPGLAIFLTVFAYNLVGEALRDALDPRTAKRGA